MIKTLIIIGSIFAYLVVGRWIVKWFLNHEGLEPEEWPEYMVAGFFTIIWPVLVFTILLALVGRLLFRGKQ